MAGYYSHSFVPSPILFTFSKIFQTMHKLCLLAAALSTAVFFNSCKPKVSDTATHLAAGNDLMLNNDLENAKKNLSNAKIRAAERTLPLDGLESGLTFRDFHNNMVNSHSITNPLMNPFNWGSLIKEIAEGDRSRAQDKDNSNNNSSTVSN